MSCPTIIVLCLLVFCDLSKITEIGTKYGLRHFDVIVMLPIWRCSTLPFIARFGFHSRRFTRRQYKIYAYTVCCALAIHSPCTLATFVGGDIELFYPIIELEQVKREIARGGPSGK